MLLHPLKTKIIYLFFFYAIIGLKANNEIDSLQTIILNPSSSIQKVDALNELAFLKIDGQNNKEALAHAEEAFSIAKQIDYKKGIADAEVRFGNLAEEDGKYSVAISFYESALSIRKENDTPERIASTYNNIGLCYSYKYNLDSAINQYNKGLNYIKKNNSRIKGKLLHNIGWAFSDKGNYELAIDYFNKSIQVWESINNQQELCGTLQEIGHLYEEVDNAEEARKIYQQSLKIAQQNNFPREEALANIFLGHLYHDFRLGRKNTALEYFTAAEVLKNNLDKNNQAILFKNLGDVYYEQFKNNQALEYYNQSLLLFKEIDVDDSNWDLAAVYYGMGNVYKASKQFSKAKQNYLKCLEYFGEDYHPLDKAEALLNLSEIYRQLGEEQASIQSYQRYSELKDSIYFNRIDAINLQHNLEKEQKEKVLLVAENLEKEKKNQRKNFLIALLFAGGLLLSAMFYAYHNRQKVKAVNLEIDELLQEQELAIAYARLDEKDITQKQIGKDLHDSLGAMLATIKLYFVDFSEKLNTLAEDTSQKQHKTIELLDEAVKEVRRIAHEMQSGVLKKFGLVEAVKELGNTITASGQLTAKVYTHGFKERIPNNLEFTLYKIIQELVSNALKHAKASKLTISLTKQEELLNIMVEDNGIGFQPNLISERSGIGLKNITYRVTELGGKCHFDSVKGRGTNVIIDVPVKVPI